MTMISLVAAALFLAKPAHAGWSADPVMIRPTLGIPLVAACNDGAFGTLVAWQEEGVLRIQHLLPTGDLDPAWPSEGAVACTSNVARNALGALPDRLGGAYLWWTEAPGPGSLFVTRVDPSGAVAAGWPQGGLALGVMAAHAPRPSAIEDGANGIYLAWAEGAVIRAHHLGGDGLGAGGWPNMPLEVVPADLVPSTHFYPDLAPSLDGGVFVSAATWSSDTTAMASGMRLRRFASDGTTATGWPVAGQSLGPFRPEVLAGAPPRSTLLAIAPDQRGGVFAAVGLLDHDGANPVYSIGLRRLQPDGQTAPGWPDEGWAQGAFPHYYDAWRDRGLDVHPDRLDGAILETPILYSDSPPISGLARCTDDGQWSALIEGVTLGHETLVGDDGEVFLADYEPTGPEHPWDLNAFIRVNRSAPAGWAPWLESHSEPALEWYGDIGLAPSGDGGAVFFWSQVRDRIGLFARRFGIAGEVTGVAPTAPAPRLSGLRFVRGTGVVARLSLDGAPAKLELFDLAGRRLASRTVQGSGSVEVALPETGSISSGLYFARLTSRSGATFGKVVVAR